MPSIAIASQQSTGHDCWPPSPAIGPYSTKTFINGRGIQLLNTTYYTDHSCGDSVHTGRHTVEASGKTFVEGIAACRVGDQISCGDTIGQGSENSFSG